MVNEAKQLDKRGRKLRARGFQIALGRVIRTRREAKGWTQATLSMALGIGLLTQLRREQGQGFPLASLIDYGEVLGVRPSVLLQQAEGIVEMAHSRPVTEGLGA